MFTGIVTSRGTITDMVTHQEGASITVAAAVPEYFADITVGQSVMVDGVCLTATTLTDNVMTADLMWPTLRATTFGHRQVGDQVHLEKAMSANGRFDGHVVSGHTDGQATLVARRVEGDTLWLTYQLPQHLVPFVVSKGSIAINGTSLTVVSITARQFDVGLIKHTQAVTTLAEQTVGDKVNIETDILAKYVLKGATDDK